MVVSTQGKCEMALVTPKNHCKNVSPLKDAVMSDRKTQKEKTLGG
jgi:hypothetical protein